MVGTGILLAHKGRIVARRTAGNAFLAMTLCMCFAPLNFNEIISLLMRNFSVLLVVNRRKRQI